MSGRTSVGLTATAATASYAEAYTVLYVAERAYHESCARMAGLFALTVRYEIAFWQMPLVADGWPGMRGDG